MVNNVVNNVDNTSNIVNSAVIEINENIDEVRLETSGSTPNSQFSSVNNCSASRKKLVSDDTE